MRTVVTSGIQKCDEDFLLPMVSKIGMTMFLLAMETKKCNDVAKLFYITGSKTFNGDSSSAIVKRK